MADRRSPLDRLIDNACGVAPKAAPATREMEDDDIAYIIYFGDKKHTLHREGLPGLTPCGKAFADIFGVIGVAKSHKADAPLCKKCFPNG